MFAAAAAANVSASQANLVGDNSDPNDDIPDAATRQAQVAATAAAFLKSMDNDELLQVVQDEATINPQSPYDDDDKITDPYYNKRSGKVSSRNQPQSIEMNQIHDDLYRQLTGNIHYKIEVLF